LETIGSDTAYYVSLDEAQIKGIVLSARKIVMEQDVLLELDAPINICGGFFVS
jgi:hypothetical protein